MGNHEIVGMVVFGLGALIVIAKPLLDLRAVLTKLEVTLDSLKQLIGDHDYKNTKDHDEIFDQLRDHDTRIVKLENRP